jgi:hypothetical protein
MRDAMTATDISARVDRKEQALRTVAAASETVIAARRDLEFISNRLTFEGLAGSNDKQRQADLAARTESEREGVALAEKGLREAQLERGVANLRVQEATMLLRVVEITRE